MRNPRLGDNNKKSAEKYAEIKKEAAKIANGDGWKYRQCKQKFLDEVKEKAMKEAIDKEVGKALKDYKAGKCRKIKSLKDLD